MKEFEWRALFHTFQTNTLIENKCCIHWNTFCEIDGFTWHIVSRLYSSFNVDNCLREGTRTNNTTIISCETTMFSWWNIIHPHWETNALISLFHTFNKLWKQSLFQHQSHQFQTNYLWKHILDNSIIHFQSWLFVHLPFYIPSSFLNDNQIHHNTSSIIIIVYWLTIFINQFNHNPIKLIPSNNQNLKHSQEEHNCHFTGMLWQTSPLMEMSIPVLCPHDWYNQFKNNKWFNHDCCHLFFFCFCFDVNECQLKTRCSSTTTHNSVMNVWFQIVSIPSQFLKTTSSTHSFILEQLQMNSIN